MVYITFPVGSVLYFNQCVDCSYFQWICVKYLLYTANLRICISLNYVLMYPVKPDHLLLKMDQKGIGFAVENHTVDKWLRKEYVRTFNFCRKYCLSNRKYVTVCMLQ